MDIKKIAEIIKDNGGRLYYVGGYVRDKIMGKTSKDIDFCVVNISLDKFRKLFKNAFLKGSSFPVFKLDNYEFALARKESKIDPGHKGFLVETKNISLLDDLLRRDITINSIAMDVLTEEIIDPFNGIEDIKRKIIRATSTHFIEDPLRVYRVAQFASRFNFNIENNTKEIMKSMRHELTTLSSERVFEEMKKALKSKKTSIFFNILKELDLLDVHFKEIYNLINIIQPLEYHPEGDVYTHSLIVLDEVSKLTKDEKIRFAGLIHDLGKALTPKEILPHHYNHDKNGIYPVKALCRRLKAPKSWEKLAVVATTEHMKAGMYNKLSIPKKVEFLEKNFKYLNELEIIAKVDSNNINLSFVKTGIQMFNNVNGKTINLPNNKNAKNILHEKRVTWLKNNG